MNSTNLNTTTELSNCRVYRVGGCPYFDFYNADCMEIMKQYPDNHFDLAIVDPPYGINRAGQTETFTKQKKHKRKHFDNKGWDNERPELYYWNELKRVSKDQIIWGANYFTDVLPPSMGWIFWDKGQDLSMSDGELAFTSFERALRRVKINRGQLMIEGGTIHPTQKPEKLYDWIIKNYAHPNQKIIDTHLGSASIAIAVHKANVLDKMNLHLTGIEIDADYFQAAMKRIKKHVSQTTISF